MFADHRQDFFNSIDPKQSSDESRLLVLGGDSGIFSEDSFPDLKFLDKPVTFRSQDFMRWGFEKSFWAKFFCAILLVSSIDQEAPGCVR